MDEGRAVPRGEREELDPTLRAGPWMFNQPFQQEVTEMIVTTTRKMEAPITQDEIGRRQHEAAMRNRELLQGATRVSRCFADSVGRATGVAPQANLSFLTARKWLMRGFSEKECCQHIDALMAEMKGKAAWEYPYRRTIASRCDEAGACDAARV